MSAATAEMAAPRAALLLKLDTLGDLVLFAPALHALQRAWPATRLSVLVRASYLDLAPVLVPGIDWVATTIDPFVQSPGQAASELARLQQMVTALAPDLVGAVTSRRNWVEVALAAAAPNAPRRVALGTAHDDPYFSTQLRLHLGLTTPVAFSECVDSPPDEPDWQRNFRLVDTLLGRAVPRVAPRLELPTAARDSAREFLRAHGLAPGRFVICAPAGFANVAIKTWPAENFGATLRHVRDQHQLPAVLIGHEGERAHLEAVRASAGGATLWLGRTGDLPVLAALLAEAALFVGNDTGALHLAAAVNVPVVGIFGGGTWPRFVPAAGRATSVVQPLPCFGCNWQCVFGDAPCVKGIAVADVTAAVDRTFADANRAAAVIHAVEHLPASTRELMGRAAARYHEVQADHLARQHQIEEKENALGQKDRDIAALLEVCREREKLIRTVDGHAHALTAQLATLRSDHALLQQTLARLPADAAASARALHDQAVHIRNLDSIIQARDVELAELRATAANRDAGLHNLEQAKHYGRLLTEKEAVIQSLRRGHAEREAVITELSVQATSTTARLHKLWTAAAAHLREKWGRPLDTWLFRKIVAEYWMQIGVLRHYDPRPLRWDERLPGPRPPEANLPQIALVTPSYGQEKFIERTLRSVVDQHYPKLLYAVQDGGSKDGSAAIIARHAPHLRHWESVPDKGQADAIHRGFAHLTPLVGPDDIMAWLNSDDLLAPGALPFVAGYFARHPDVDVLYGHRIIIDGEDREIGRWIMPRHNPATLEWIDYVPQETLFWRKRAWDLAGGIDPSFQFALDWDLLARFQLAGCKVVRVPYFLGAFRVHAEQKTSQAIHTVGAEEMRRIRTRFHGERQDDFASIDQHARDARFWGAITARLHEVGIRW